MPSESILFAPEIDERQLDRETDQVNDQLSQVGEDVPMNFDAEMPDTGGLDTPGGGGGGGGIGGLEAGMAGLASKIPKPVAGVASAAALPIALAGGVGMGILSKMSAASARMGTSVSLMQVANDNFFRAPGDLFDKKITRPLAQSLLDQSQAFETMFREGDFGGAAEVALTGVDRREATTGKRAIGFGGSVAGAIGGGLAGAKAGGIAGGAIGSIIPGAGTVAGAGIGATGGAIVGAIAGAFGGGRIATALADAITGVDISALSSKIVGAATGFVNSIGPAASEFAGDIRTAASDFAGDIKGGASALAKNIRNTSLTDIWKGTVSLGEWMWSGSVGFGKWMWSGATSLGSWMWSGAITWGKWMFDGAINWGKWMFKGALNWGEWMFDGGINLGNQVVGSIDISDYVTGAIGWGGDDLPSGASGGRVTSSGLAEIHKDEILADPDRLVSELASAVSQSTGGGGGTRMDTRGMERKLDRLHDDLRRLESALDVTLQVGSEEIGRAVADGKQNRMADTDPLI